jgi:hypothetical protein
MNDSGRDRNLASAMTIRNALIVLVMVAGGLLALVIVVGLWRGDLNPTAAANLLAGLLISITGGLIADAKFGGEK